jgi:peptidoglycan/LPS O-acetylase OafA/YrhL
MNRTLIKDNLRLLDSLRGFAAIYVLIHHCRWLLWEGYEKGYLQHPGTYSFLNKLQLYFFSCFKFGNEAVLFFFVLSGFVIHYSVSRRIEKDGQFKVGDYFIKRFRRIYPPLVIAILVTFVLDTAGMKWQLPIYFSNTPYPSINQNIHPDLSLTTLLGNLFFVQKIYTPVWGTNGALWSLLYEWWFYMLYIPLLFLFRKNKYLVTGAVVLVWFLNLAYGSVLPVLVYKVLNLFIIWFAGMLLAEVLLSEAFSLKAAGAFLLLIIVGVAAGNFPLLGKEIILTVVISVLLFVILTTNWFNFLKRKIFAKLGAMSYTLYAVHMPIVCIISGFVMKAYNGYLPSHFLFIWPAIIVSLAVSWVLHLVGEKPFTKK